MHQNIAKSILGKPIYRIATISLRFKNYLLNTAIKSRVLPRIKIWLRIKATF